MYDLVSKYCRPVTTEADRLAAGTIILNWITCNTRLHSEALFQCAKHSTHSPSAEHRAFALELLGAIVGCRPTEPRLVLYMSAWFSKNLSPSLARSLMRLMHLKRVEEDASLRRNFEIQRPNNVSMSVVAPFDSADSERLATLRAPFRTVQLKSKPYVVCAPL